MVLALLLFDTLRVLRHPSHSRRDRRRGRHREPPVALHRHADRHARREPALLGAGGAPDAGALHRVDLPVLHDQPGAVSDPLRDDERRRQRMGRPRLLHLGGHLQSLHRLGLLGVPRRRLQQRAEPPAVRLHRRRGHHRRYRRLRGDVDAGCASRQRPAPARVGRAARGGGVRRASPRPDLARPARAVRPARPGRRGGRQRALGIRPRHAVAVSAAPDLLHAALHDSLDVSLLPAGRHREAEFHEPRRAHGLLRQYRSRRSMS